MASKDLKEYKTFEEFYPFYLGEHSDKTNRRLHFVGTSLAIALLFLSIFASIGFLKFVPLVGYGFAWVGHFFFEKNRPATFKYPLFSLIGDFKMWYQIATGHVVF